MIVLSDKVYFIEPLSAQYNLTQVRHAFLQLVIGFYDYCYVTFYGCLPVIGVLLYVTAGVDRLLHLPQC